MAHEVDNAGFWTVVSGNAALMASGNPLERRPPTAISDVFDAPVLRKLFIQPRAERILPPSIMATHSPQEPHVRLRS